MKKLIAVALIGAMMFSIAGCGEDNSKSKKKSKDKEKSAEKIVDEEDSDDIEDDDDKDAHKDDRKDDLFADEQKDSSPVVFQSSKSQTYLNEDGGTEGYSFIMYDVDSDGNNIFIGVKGQVSDSKLTANINDVFNDSIKVSEVDLHYAEFRMNDEYYYFEQDLVVYDDSDEVALLDDHEVEYQDGNYYIAGTNIDKYILCYKYGDFSWSDNPFGTCYILRLGFSDTVEEAKAKLDAHKEKFEIVTFTDYETINKVDYKKYTCFNDLLVDLLNSYGLFVDSYEYVCYNRKIEVYKDLYGVEIEIDDGNFTDLDGLYNFTVNGITAYVDGRKVKYNLGDEKVDFYFYLPYDVEETNENIEAAFRSLFS